MRSATIQRRAELVSQPLSPSYRRWLAGICSTWNFSTCGLGKPPDSLPEHKLRIETTAWGAAGDLPKFGLFVLWREQAKDPLSSHGSAPRRRPGAGPARGRPRHRGRRERGTRGLRGRSWFRCCPSEAHGPRWKFGGFSSPSRSSL